MRRSRIVVYIYKIKQKEDVPQYVRRYRQEQNHLLAYSEFPSCHGL